MMIGRIPYARGNVSDKTKIREVAGADILLNLIFIFVTAIHKINGTAPSDLVEQWYVLVFGIIIRIIMLIASMYLICTSGKSEPIEKRIECAKLWVILCGLYILSGISAVLTLHFLLGYKLILCLDTIAMIIPRLFFILLVIAYMDKLKWQKTINDGLKGHVTMEEWLK